MPNKIIGKVITDLNEDGIVTKSVFVPHQYQGEINLGLNSTRVLNEGHAVHHALRMVAEYFVHMGNIEMHDPDVEKMEHRVLVCLNWPDGTPKHCEIEFYMQDIEPEKPYVVALP